MISPLFLRARNNQVNFVENPQMKMISSEKQNMEIQFIKIFKETAVNRTGQFINEWSLEIFIQMKPLCFHVISKLELCIKCSLRYCNFLWPFSIKPPIYITIQQTQCISAKIRHISIKHFLVHLFLQPDIVDFIINSFSSNILGL